MNVYAEFIGTVPPLVTTESTMYSSSETVATSFRSSYSQDNGEDTDFSESWENEASHFASTSRGHSATSLIDNTEYKTNISYTSVSVSEVSNLSSFSFRDTIVDGNSTFTISGSSFYAITQQFKTSYVSFSHSNGTDRERVTGETRLTTSYVSSSSGTTRVSTWSSSNSTTSGSWGTGGGETLVNNPATNNSGTQTETESSFTFPNPETTSTYPDRQFVDTTTTIEGHQTTELTRSITRTTGTVIDSKATTTTVTESVNDTSVVGATLTVDTKAVSTVGTITYTIEGQEYQLDIRNVTVPSPGEELWKFGYVGSPVAGQAGALGDSTSEVGYRSYVDASTSSEVANKLDSSVAQSTENITGTNWGIDFSSLEISEYTYPWAPFVSATRVTLPISTVSGSSTVVVGDTSRDPESYEQPTYNLIHRGTVSTTQYRTSTTSSTKSVYLSVGNVLTSRYDTYATPTTVTVKTSVWTVSTKEYSTQDVGGGTIANGNSSWTTSSNESIDRGATRTVLVPLGLNEAIVAGEGDKRAFGSETHHGDVYVVAPEQTDESEGGVILTANQSIPNPMIVSTWGRRNRIAIVPYPESRAFTTGNSFYSSQFVYSTLSDGSEITLPPHARFTSYSTGTETVSTRSTYSVTIGTSIAPSVQVRDAVSVLNGVNMPYTNADVLRVEANATLILAKGIYRVKIGNGAYEPVTVNDFQSYYASVPIHVEKSVGGVFLTPTTNNGFANQDAIMTFEKVTNLPLMPWIGGTI